MLLSLAGQSNGAPFQAPGRDGVHRFPCASPPPARCKSHFPPSTCSHGHWRPASTRRLRPAVTRFNDGPGWPRRLLVAEQGWAERLHLVDLWIGRQDEGPLPANDADHWGPSPKRPGAIPVRLGGGRVARRAARGPLSCGPRSGHPHGTVAIEEPSWCGHLAGPPPRGRNRGGESDARDGKGWPPAAGEGRATIEATAWAASLVRASGCGRRIIRAPNIRPTDWPPWLGPQNLEGAAQMVRRQFQIPG